MEDKIVLQWVATNNLKNIDIEIPKNKIITMTGVSWSGKSSLAFHTIYKEGQFRYIESLSSYLRQMFNLGSRPELEFSSGLSPAVSIEQNKRIWNSRSTMWTLTELDDYLRLMMSKLWEVYCHECWDPLRPKTTDEIVQDILKKFDGQKVYLLQDYGVFEDAGSLQKFVRSNRKQVDNWWWLTRIMIQMGIEMEQSSEENSMIGESIEYFYLEDPQIPEELFPVRVQWVFDRITVNESVQRRLKDDIIKMLGRTEKFGVKTATESSEIARKNEKVDKKSKKEKLPGEGYRIVIFHGYKSSPKKHRMPWIKKQFEAQWFTVEIPALPKPDNLNLNKQIEFALKNGTYDDKTIVIWHSAWSIVAQKVVEWVESPIAWMILVWWLLEPKLKGKQTRDYFETFDWDFDAQLIKNKAQDVLIVHDAKDKIIPKTQATKLQKVYDAVLVTPKAEDNHFVADKETHLFDEMFSFFQTQISPNLWKNDWMWNTSWEVVWYTDKYYCAKDDIKYPELTPAHFSANRQEWACEKCHGLGEILQVDFEKVLDPYSKYLKALLPWRDSNLGQAILNKLAQVYNIDVETRRWDLPEWFREVILKGDEEQYRLNVWWGKYITTTYKWVEDVLIAQYQKWLLTVDFQAMLDMMSCPSCHGAKLRKEALAVHVVLDSSKKKDAWLLNLDDVQEKYNIFELQSLPMSKLVTVMEKFAKTAIKKQELVKRIVWPLLDRAQTIEELWLWYLATFRQIGTLSGGEIQRLRLAKQLGNRLTWIIYVLDEPTIWLNEGEIKRVIKAIRWLQEMWNTIIVVEHNDDFIKTSDWIVEVGPWAGDFWWEIVFNGTYKDFLKADTLTSQYITWKKTVQATFDHTPSSALVKIKKASKHNLKSIDVEIALGSFTIITGPSGAGKTTLMYHTLFNFLEEKQKWVQSQIRLQLLKEWLSWQDIIQAPVMQRKKYEHLEKLALEQFYQHIWVDTIQWREEIDNVMYVNQSSIGKTPRSCPSTFVWVFDDIRKIYAGVTESKMLWFNAGHFSFNSAKGACPECKWYGWRKVELQFLPDAYVHCELCKWRRYKPEILDIRWHEHTISQILDMYVMDAYEFFDDIPFIKDKLQLLMDIGLGYLRMGQPAHTLSWGESQRLKLVKHLLKQYRGHTVYFLDEPTVGLHPADIERLLKVLKKFLDDGDTILMIEHDQHLLKFADKVIRLDNWKVVKK